MIRNNSNSIDDTIRSRSSGSISSSSRKSLGTVGTVPYFFQLIQEQKWKKVRKCLKSRKRQQYCAQRDGSELTCLALALAYSAPLDIIKSMVETDPTLPGACDIFGATALHLGCLNGLSLDSLDYLLSHNSEIAKQLDLDLRSAMHHAVEFACCNISNAIISDDIDDNGLRRVGDDFSFELIRKVHSAAPEMIHARDNSGGTPLDLVQLIKVDTQDRNSEEYKRYDRIYQLLKQFSIDRYRKQKQIWEFECFDLNRKFSSIQTLSSLRKATPSPQLDNSAGNTSASSASRTSASNSTNFTPHSTNDQTCVMNLSAMQESDYEHSEPSKEHNSKKNETMIWRREPLYH
jgi:hypothetical protein